jgi:hypothetical protein
MRGGQIAVLLLTFQLYAGLHVIRTSWPYIKDDLEK